MPVIVEREVPVLIPAYRDTTIVLRDTVIVLDSVWYSDVVDSLGKKIGDLTVYYKKKIASLNLLQDTILVKTVDTVKVPTQGTVLETVSGFLNWWEEGLLLLVAMLLLTWKAKRKTII